MAKIKIHPIPHPVLERLLSKSDCNYASHNFRELPANILYLLGSYSKTDITETMGLDQSNIDYAIPVHLSADIRDKTGRDISGHCVMYYESGSVFPAIKPITLEGELILDIYFHILNNPK